MRSLILLFGLVFLCIGAAVKADAPSSSVPQKTVEQSKEVKAQAVVDNLDKPLYNPFVERYVLDEIKQLRMEMASQRVEMMEKILDRDLMVSDKAMSYSANTVTYFFYLIAAVSTILVIVGWTSIRDIRDKVHSVADKEVQKLVDTYEKRLRSIERQLMQETQNINENRAQIEKTQEVHALWLRAGQEHSEQAKIAIYDEILAIRSDDVEALTYKADTVLELTEPQWAKNLCLQALALDPNYGHAHYQLACANVALGNFEEAVAGLVKAVQLSDTIIDDVLHDKALAALRGHTSYKDLLELIGLESEQPPQSPS